MFDDFLSNCPMEDRIKPPRKRVRKNIAALKSLIETEENAMTKRRRKLKPLIIAALITIISTVSLLTVNAAMQGAVIKFILGGEKVEGEFYDYVDSDGYRRVSFETVLPLYENKYAFIFDADAPKGENVRVLTPDTDPEFFEKLRLFVEARERVDEKFNAEWDAQREAVRKWKGISESDWYDLDHEVKSAAVDEAEKAGIVEPLDFPRAPDPEDYGFVFKDNELCVWTYGHIDKENHSDYRMNYGQFGGKFMDTGAAENMPHGSGVKEHNERHHDYENETTTYKHTFYWYVGK